MKSTVLTALLLLSAHALVLGQAKQNTNKKGVLIDGYDPVAYFDNTVKKGVSTYQTKYNGSSIYFSSSTNLEKFKKNPDKYYPMYGGWCAYAMGTNGEYVEIDADTYEIRDGHLYLFYNRLLTNTKKSWLDEDPLKLKKQADANWKKLQK